MRFFSAKNFLRTLGAIAIVMTLGIAQAPFSRAQSLDIDQKLSETQEGVSALLEVKDSTTLSAQEKARKEVELKKQIVLGVIDLAKAQLKDSKEKLDALTLPDTDEWKNLREYYDRKIESHNEFYDKTRNDIIAAARAFATDSLTQLTKKLEEEKLNKIDPTVEQMTNVIIVFNTENILILADERLKKIENDITKVYAQKLVQNEDLKTLFDQSAQILESSHQKNKEAQEIIIHLYAQDDSTLPNRYLEDLSKKLQDAVQTSTATTTSNSTTAQAPQSIGTYLQSLIIGSLRDIRSTYDIFIEMSVNVTKYLR